LTSLVDVASVLIATAHQVTSGSFVGLSGAAKLELTSISLLGELSGSFLSLVQVVVDGLDATILVGVLASLASVKVARTLNFILITSSFLLELGTFVTGVVDFFAQGVAAVRFLGDITLGGEDLGLATRDLLASGSNFSLEVVVRSVLFI